MKRILIAVLILSMAGVAWGDRRPEDEPPDVLIIDVPYALPFYGVFPDKILKKDAETPKTCWEYYTVGNQGVFVSFLSQEELKKMGNMEWELVSVAPIHSMPGANVYYFKRPVECGVKP